MVGEPLQRELVTGYRQVQVRVGGRRASATARAERDAHVEAVPVRPPRGAAEEAEAEAAVTQDDATAQGHAWPQAEVSVAAWLPEALGAPD